jgi:hypothetical protein
MAESAKCWEVFTASGLTTMAFGVEKSTPEPSSKGAGSAPVEQATEVEQAASTSRDGISDRFVIPHDLSGPGRER